MAMSFQELNQADIVWQQLPIEQHLSFFVMRLEAGLLTNSLSKPLSTKTGGKPGLRFGTPKF